MKFRVFIIDGEMSICHSFRNYLKLQGYEVLTASKPAQCHIYLGRKCEKDTACADVLLVDYNLPEMTGLEFLEQMEKGGCKVHSKNKVLLSRDITLIDPKRSARVGCQIIQKPLSLSEVDARIADAKTRLGPNRKSENSIEPGLSHSSLPQDIPS